MKMKLSHLGIALLAAMSIGLSSCHDDTSLPDVDFTIGIEGATRADGYLYVAQGSKLEITSVDVLNRVQGQGAMITGANYYWDYYYVGSSIEMPYGFEFDITDSTPVGDHLVQIECPLYAVNAEPATAVVTMRVRVVASEDDVPAADGSASYTTHPSVSSTAGTAKGKY